MTTYPSSLSVTPALTDETTLEATVACLSEHLQVDMKGAYSAEDLFQILVYAASRSDTIEHTAQSLHGVPSGNEIRYHLDQWADMATLEAQVNAALSSRIPPRIAKHQQCKQSIAIDLNLLPYYGQVTPESAPYLYRSQAKAGTTTFFAYATAYVICRNKRVTLVIHAVHRQETLGATVSYLVTVPSASELGNRCSIIPR